MIAAFATDKNRIKGMLSNFNIFQENVSSIKKAEDYEIIVRNVADEDHSEPLKIMFTTDFYDIIVQFLSAIKEVIKIFVIRERNTFCIWTICSKDDKNIRYKIYEKELEIIKNFSKTEFHFDLYLADMEDSKELLSSGVKCIYPQN